jgi:hypothetical protein
MPIAVFKRENTIVNLRKHVMQQNTNGKSENNVITVSNCSTGFIFCKAVSIICPFV